MPSAAYFTLLQEGPLPPLRAGAERAGALAVAARAAGFPADAYVFEALAARGAGLPAPELPAADREDTQLRAWRTYVAGGVRHLFLRLVPAAEGAGRSGRITEALRLLGHRAECLDPDVLAAEPGGLGAALAARVMAILAKRPWCEAVLVGYDAACLQALAPMRHHLVVVYGHPANPAEGFQARYIHRGTRVAPPRLPARRPLFSIVIPTRNNPHCLEHALRTCLEQPFDDFEVVIGDNSNPGNRETEKLVRRLNSERLRYFRADRLNKLNDSFEFAHARALGEYVLGLGSDDGLLHHGLGTLAQVLAGADGPVDALRFDYVYYGWPNAQPRRFQNFLRIPPTIVKRPEGPRLAWLDSRETLDRFARYDIPFYEIPNGYGYSILSRRLLDRIQAATGRCFPGNTHDFYTGVYTLALTERFARLDFPITAFAVSGASVGSAMTHRGPERNLVGHDLEGAGLRGDARPVSVLDAEGRDSWYDECTPRIGWVHERLETCGYSSDEVINAQAIVDAVNRKVLPREYLARIGWQRHFDLCSHYLYQGDPDLGFKLEELRERMARRGDPALAAWFGEQPFARRDFMGHEPPPVQERFRYGLLPNGVLYLDGRDFGLANVYDAVQLVRKIAHL
jgi:hypothetical protein